MASMTKKVELGKPSVNRNPRHLIANAIKKWFLGKQNCNAQVQFLGELKGGLITASERWLEREDIFCIQYQGICNVFVDLIWDPKAGEPTFRTKIDLWKGAALHVQDREKIAKDVARIMGENKEYVELARKFFKERPWERVVGLNPEEALAILEAAGWGACKVCDGSGFVVDREAVKRGNKKECECRQGLGKPVLVSREIGGGSDEEDDEFEQGPYGTPFPK